MVSLPTGTVTFLLTDIEGSTTLWERDPETMRRALACHDALIAAGVVCAEGVPEAVELPTDRLDELRRW